MNCREVQHRLPDYARKMLPDRETNAVEEHLRTCSSCQRELKELQRVVQTLKSREESPAPAHYWSNLLPRIHARIEERQRRWLPSWIPRLVYPVAAAALLLVVMMRVGTFDGRKLVVPEENRLRALLEEVEVSELQRFAEFDGGLTLYGFTESGDEGDVLSGDRSVLASLLSDEEQLYSRIDLNGFGTSEDLQDQEVKELITFLDQQKL